MSSTAAQMVTGVHVGVWTNWSHGRLHGSTLTLSRRHGGLLTAFIALFATFVGTRFWRLACFGLHTALSKAYSPQDALYHQRQVVLRNSETSLSGMGTYVQLLWAWKRHTDLQRPLQRVLPLIVLSSASALGFAIAGVFSSQISTRSGNEVLIAGAKPGYFNYSLVTNITDSQLVLQPYVNQALVQEANYASRCYQFTASKVDCPTYVRESISFNTTSTAPCPFSNHLCMDQGTNLRLDTGLIDSLDDLGINAPLEDRFQLRYVLNCAPLVSDGYTTLYNGSDGTQFLRFYYGIHSLKTNYTYEYPTNRRTTNLDTHYTSAADLDYTIASRLYSPAAPDGMNDFTPVPGLLRDDADTLLFFLSSNSVTFTAPVDDSWYSAHSASNRSNTTTSSSTKPKTYSADDPARALGCHIQQQMCNPNLPKSQACTPLASARDQSTASTFWPNGTQADLLNWYTGAIAGSARDPWSIVNQLGISALTSRNTLQSGLQIFLPPNQWQLEVSHWYGTFLASLQQAWVAAATGPPSSYPGLNQYIQGPKNPLEAKMYRNQKIRSSDYTNFSILGITLTFAFGTLIILLSYTIEPLSQLIQKCSGRRRDAYTRLEWITNETLQLQRLVHEEIGLGSWSRATADVPVSGGYDLLGVLDLTNPEHPMLRDPRANAAVIREGGRIGDAEYDHGKGLRGDYITVPADVDTLSERRRMSGLT